MAIARRVDARCGKPVGTSFSVGSPRAVPALAAAVAWREREVGRGALAFIMLAALVAMFWLNWWTVAFWVTGLFGWLVHVYSFFVTAGRACYTLL